MNCRKVASVTSEYLDGCLTGGQLEEFERHVRECGDCTTELRETREMVLSLGMLAARSCPVDCWEGVCERIPAVGPPGRSWRYWLMRPIVAAPALAAACALAAFLVLPIGQGESSMGGPVPYREYSQYVSAHARAQRQQAFTDPDVVVVAAELERASLASDQGRP